MVVYVENGAKWTSFIFHEGPERIFGPKHLWKSFRQLLNRSRHGLGDINRVKVEPACKAREPERGHRYGQVNSTQFANPHCAAEKFAKSLS